MRTLKTVLAAAAAAALALGAGCAPDTANPPANNNTSSSAAATGDSSAPAAPANTDPVKVGIIYSETGPLAAYGETFYNGFLAGLDYATDGTGEVNGRKLDVTYTDDGGDPGQGRGRCEGADRRWHQDHPVAPSPPVSR